MRIFAAGLMVFIAADVTYGHITVHSTYLGGDPVDTLSILALTILLVRRLPAARRARRGRAAPPRPLFGRPRVLPYLAVAGRYLLLTVVGLHGISADPPGVVLLGSVSADLPGRRAATRRVAGLRPARGPVQGAGRDRRDDRPVRPAPLHGNAEAPSPRPADPAPRRADDRRGQLQADQRHAWPRRRRPAAPDLAGAEHVRPGIAGRYGGDEFTILVPGITSLRAVQLAARWAGARPRRRPEPGVCAAAAPPLARGLSDPFTPFVLGFWWLRQETGFLDTGRFSPLCALAWPAAARTPRRHRPGPVRVRFVV